MNEKNLPESLYKIRPHLFAIKVGLAVTLIGIGSYLVLSTSVLGVICGVTLIGAMIAHMVELQHQALHYTGFKSKRLNRFVGFFLGLPALVSFRHYQVNHMRHHRFCGTPKDSEFFRYQNDRHGTSAFGLFRAAFDISRLRQFWVNLASSIRATQPITDFSVPEATEISIRTEYIILGAAALTAIGSCIFLGYGLELLLLWVLPLILVAEPIHFLIELPEHLGCDLEDRSAFGNTRTIKGSPFSYWFTNGNNFHVEHHMYPSVPIDRLNILHNMIKPSIRHYSKNYLEFFKIAVNSNTPNAAEVAVPGEAQ